MGIFESRSTRLGVGGSFNKDPTILGGYVKKGTHIWGISPDESWREVRSSRRTKMATPLQLLKQSHAQPRSLPHDLGDAQPRV